MIKQTGSGLLCRTTRLGRNMVSLLQLASHISQAHLMLPHAIPIFIPTCGINQQNILHGYMVLAQHFFTAFCHQMYGTTSASLSQHFALWVNTLSPQRSSRTFINCLPSRKTNLSDFFYQHQVDCIHSIWPCVHLTSHHLASEAAHIGSPRCSQWTMECTIGNLGLQIQQPSDQFSNLAQQGIQRCQFNALKAMLPQLNPLNDSIPRGTTDLGNSYIILPKHNCYATKISVAEGHTFSTYLGQDSTIPKVYHWGWLQLPNGQVAHSEFTELEQPPEEVRMACNVKVGFPSLSSLYSLTLS